MMMETMMLTKKIVLIKFNSVLKRQYQPICGYNALYDFLALKLFLRLSKEHMRIGINFICRFRHHHHRSLHSLHFTS